MSSPMHFADRAFFSLPTALRIFFSIIVVALIVAYALFQARHLITGPIITLTDPLPAVISTSTITVRGRAENIVSLSLNGRPIFTTDEGTFEEAVTLVEGYTILTIEARDRYGNAERLEHNIVRLKEQGE